jgi:hypothetical protein
MSEIMAVRKYSYAYHQIVYSGKRNSSTVSDDLPLAVKNKRQKKKSNLKTASPPGTGGDGGGGAAAATAPVGGASN